MSTVTIKFDVDIESLVFEISDNLDYNELFKLIKDIDIYQQDWDFTLKIYDHFKKLKDKYDKEIKEIG